MERDISVIEQQLKEARRRSTSNQEKAALASMEERYFLVRQGNACQDLRRLKEKLREARRSEDGR